MKRILFVDDEPKILKGLERSLNSMDLDWEMVFVESGEAALAALAREPFDVVVSDMLMPVMNGAQLLTEVMARYPKTVRIVLSGHAGISLVMQCVAATHQYLSKPCDAELIVATIERVTRLQELLHNDSMRSLTTKLRRLPSKPALYVQIMDKLKDPDIELTELAAIVEKDLAMTAKLLKLANSAFFGLQHEVTSPAEAVSYLGIDTLKALILTMRIFDQFQQFSVPGLSLVELWQHSSATAAAAKAIAKSENAPRILCEEAFTAGLLHDCGILILADNLGASYAEVIHSATVRKVPVSVVEQEVFGSTHAEIGGYLMGLWGLPSTIVEAIVMHHKPEVHRIPKFSPLTAVHAANSLIDERFPSIPKLAPPPLDESYLGALGLMDKVSRWKVLLEGVNAA